jgi:acetoacetate decarboxylase
MANEPRHRDAYPPPPWRLGGWGIATVGLLASAAAAEFVPEGAQLVTVLPGKTVGGMFFLAYEFGSLVYRELNVVAGLVRVGARLAFVLPRLYVDSPASLAGGREIWAVPKELATFEIGQLDGETSIDVAQGARRICCLRSRGSGPRLCLPLPLPSLGVRDETFAFFTARLRAAFSLANVDVTLGPGSEFAALGLERPRFGVRCDDLTLAVPAPLAIRRLLPRSAQSAC